MVLVCGCPSNGAPPRRVRVANRTRDRILASDVRLAIGFFPRLRGLIGHARLGDGAGLLIMPCWSIHTLGVRFPFDAVFVRADGRVLRVAVNLRPNRLGPIVWGAAGVLELPVGTIERTGTRVGDSIAIAYGDDRVAT